MAKNMEKSQAGMKTIQLEMAMKQRQSMMAMQTAMARERVKYYSVLAGAAWIFLPIAIVKKKNPMLVAPLFIISLSWTFQYDMAYGNMSIRAQKEASKLIAEEPERFFLPSTSGFMTQKEYNELMGISADYKPKLK